ncbi:uncharacterized protein LOC141586211 [Silene latifolia]|uniref:uncharacterized protein LOC141586211 n=1 Tax=Silene latifolia TaxID=37657 RepID=UPI003D7830FB
MRHIITKFPPKTLIKRLLTTTATTTTTTPGKLDRIATEVLSLNAVELHDYSILFSLKMGLKTAGPASISSGSGPSAQAADAAPAAAEAKTVFELKLEKFDAASKIKIIKEVRTFTSLGLKEAKDLVEKAPSVIKTGVSKEEGEAIVEKLKQLGATVVLE